MTARTAFMFMRVRRAARLDFITAPDCGGDVELWGCFTSTTISNPKRVAKARMALRSAIDVPPRKYAKAGFSSVPIRWSIHELYCCILVIGLPHSVNATGSRRAPEGKAIAHADPPDGGRTGVRDRSLGPKLCCDLAAFLPIRKKRGLAITSRHRRLVLSDAGAPASRSPARSNSCDSMATEECSAWHGCHAHTFRRFSADPIAATSHRRCAAAAGHPCPPARQPPHRDRRRSQWHPDGRARHGRNSCRCR